MTECRLATSSSHSSSHCSIRSVVAASPTSTVAFLRASLLVAAVAVSGCVIGLERDGDRDRTAACSPANCDGCCLGNVCRPGNTLAACGSDGLGCVSCLDDEVCEDGRCRIDFTVCGPDNCAGCCVDNECVAGTTALTCGVGGLACDTCESGEACMAGACVPSTAECGPQTCVGCCRLGVCEPGTGLSACGAGGGACVGCTDGDVCRSGKCQEPPAGPCSPATCNGCCLDGVCQPGVAAEACGRFGAACLACTGGLTCRAGGCAQPGKVGDACSHPDECADGYCAAAPGGGYCLATCIPEACPGGSTCVQLSDDENDTWCMASCLTDDDCRAEHRCLPLDDDSGACFPRCTDDSQCSTNVCDRSTGECVVSVVGTGCSGDADCGEGYFCAANSPGGYCSRICDHNRPCPAGSACVSQGSTSVCLATCEDSADCRNADYLCIEGHCLARCHEDSDCPLRSVCDTASGRCVEGGPPAGTIGAECLGSEACGVDGLCITEEEDSFPGGYCVKDCTTDHEGCPAGSSCWGFGQQADPDFFALCLGSCSDHLDCREGYVCLGRSDLSDGYCFPGCGEFDYCREGFVCDGQSGLCIEESSGDGITIDRSTPHSVNIPVMAYSQDVVVTVPQDAISLTLSVDGGADASFFLARVKGPDGKDWFSSGDLGQSRLRPNPLPTGGSQVTYIPNTPSLSLPPGQYRFSFAADTRQELGWPTVLLKKSASGTVQSGTLDVNFVFVGHPTLTATTAQTNASFQSLVDTFSTRLGEVGITVGEIDYFDLQNDVFRFSSLDRADLGALVRTATTLPDDRLTVYWVREIRSGGLSGGGIILGISAGIPGAPLRGTGNAGVAMALGDFPGFGWSPTQVAGTLVHEVGHWLGLFHTTERNGQSFDVLADTPECTTARDTDGDGMLSAPECEYDGGTNVMFWASDPSLDQIVLTPNQRFVMLRHPAVR